MEERSRAGRGAEEDFREQVRNCYPVVFQRSQVSSLCLSTSMSVYVYVCLCLCLSTSMSVYVYVCLYLCLSTSMFVYVYVYVVSVVSFISKLDILNL